MISVNAFSVMEAAKEPVFDDFEGTDATDVTRLVGEGLVAEDWKDNATNGIETWDDIVKPEVEIITPNPGSSGSARWNIARPASARDLRLRAGAVRTRS